MGSVLGSFNYSYFKECYWKSGFSFNSEKSYTELMGSVFVSFILPVSKSAIGNLIFNQLRESYTVLMGSVLGSFNYSYFKECYRRSEFPVNSEKWYTEPIRSLYVSLQLENVIKILLNRELSEINFRSTQNVCCTSKVSIGFFKIIRNKLL